MLTSYDFGVGKVGLCLQPETNTLMRASKDFPATAFIETTCGWSYRVRGMLQVRNELAVPIELGIISPSSSGISHAHVIAANGSSDESQYFPTLPEILANGKVMYRPIIYSSAVKADYHHLGHVQDLIRGVLDSSRVPGLPDGVKQACAQFKKLNFHAVADLRSEEHGARVLSIVPSVRIRNLLPAPINVLLTSFSLIPTKPCEMTLAPGQSAAVDCVSRSQTFSAGHRLQLALPSVGLPNWSLGLNRLDLSGNEKEDTIALLDGRAGELNVIVKVEKAESKSKDFCVVLYVRCCLVNRTGLQLDLGAQVAFGMASVSYARNAIALKKLTSESADILQAQPSSESEDQIEDQIVLLSPSKSTQEHVNLHLRLKSSSKLKMNSWSQKLKIDRDTQPGRVVLEGSDQKCPWLGCACFGERIPQDLSNSWCNLDPASKHTLPSGESKKYEIAFDSVAAPSAFRKTVVLTLSPALLVTNHTRYELEMEQVMCLTLSLAPEVSESRLHLMTAGAAD